MRRLARGEVLVHFLTFAAGVILTTLLEYLGHLVSAELHGWNAWSVPIIGAGLVANSLAVLYVIQRVDEMQRKNRIAFQYFDRDSGMGRRELLSMVAKLEPGSEFFVLNYFNHRFESFDRETEALRHQYFQALQSKLKVTHYRRIVQADPTEKLAALVDDSYLAHFREVVGIRDQGTPGRSVQLARVPIRYPYSFFIVKNPSGSKYLSWDVFEESPTTGRLKIIGSLLVTDPDEQLIAPFEALFRNLESSPDLRVIRMQHLASGAARP